jgi:hypothetical protein
VDDTSTNHRRAADRHASAARTHERSSAYWVQQGDAEYAALRQDLAEHERQAADLERRCAALIERRTGCDD